MNQLQLDTHLDYEHLFASLWLQTVSNIYSFAATIGCFSFYYYFIFYYIHQRRRFCDSRHLSVCLSFCLRDFNYISWKGFLPKIKGQYRRLRDCDPSQPCNLVLLLSVHVLKSHYAGGWAAWWRSELSQSFTAGWFFIEVQCTQILLLFFNVDKAFFWCVPLVKSINALWCCYLHLQWLYWRNQLLKAAADPPPLRALAPWRLLKLEMWYICRLEVRNNQNMIAEYMGSGSFLLSKLLTTASAGWSFAAFILC